MRKKISEDEFEETTGPMNATAKYDAVVYANVEHKKELDIHDERAIRAKKEKLIREQENNARFKSASKQIKAQEKIELAINIIITNFTTKSALMKSFHKEKSVAPPKPTT